MFNGYNSRINLKQKQLHEVSNWFLFDNWDERHQEMWTGLKVKSVECAAFCLAETILLKNY